METAGDVGAKSAGGSAFWDRWLAGVGGGMALFGLALALLQGSPLLRLFVEPVDRVFWGDRAVPMEAVAFRTWIYGVLGATVAGWGVFLTWGALGPFARRERWVRDCIVAGIAVWFVPDTAISLAHGVVFNAGFNAVMVLLVVPPLAACWSEFRDRGR
jgi:hypothetical protein